MITYCDVIERCEDCPRYADDCDGDKRVEHTDYISRADAIEAVVSWTVEDRPHEVMPTDLVDRIKALPSAEAEPIVIRSRTLMPTKDFKEWAKRVRDENPNVIVIPCDAEVASAVPQLKQTDTLIIADALRYLAKDTERHELDRTRAEELREQILQYGASMCSSAEAVQGEWVDVKNEPYCECSVCGSYIDNLDDDYAFCPRCGARMTPYKGGAE